MKPEDTRSVEQLEKVFLAGSRPKFVYFWGHSTRSNEVNQTCFSQWYPASFIVDGQTFNTAEHYMMYAKAKLFKDEQTAKKILDAKSPGAAKALGRQVRGFVQSVWDENCFDIVVTANLNKFKQNPGLKNYLLNTKKRVLVEASPKDSIWGIGMDVHTEGAKNPLKWRGENLLGFALMEVRARIG